MYPVEFIEQNNNLEKPINMVDSECASLPVWQGMVRHGNDNREFPTIISKWKLTEEELAEVIKTGCVWLAITGVVMPPVSVFTNNILEGIDNNVNQKELEIVYYETKDKSEIYEIVKEMLHFNVGFLQTTLQPMIDKGELIETTKEKFDEWRLKKEQSKFN